MMRERRADTGDRERERNEKKRRERLLGVKKGDRPHLTEGRATKVVRGRIERKTRSAAVAQRGVQG